ncbi:MAG: hypothetical protein M1837_001411 [Sclerophora amabilis]|nr:MAG: hypothetical protein M1837_001411 [Sclerophora amabilis]
MKGLTLFIFCLPFYVGATVEAPPPFGDFSLPTTSRPTAPGLNDYFLYATDLGEKGEPHADGRDTMAEFAVKKVLKDYLKKPRYRTFPRAAWIEMPNWVHQTELNITVEQMIELPMPVVDSLIENFRSGPFGYNHTRYYSLAMEPKDPETQGLPGISGGAAAYIHVFPKDETLFSSPARKMVRRMVRTKRPMTVSESQGILNFMQLCFQKGLAKPPPSAEEKRDLDQDACARASGGAANLEELNLENLDMEELSDFEDVEERAPGLDPPPSPEGTGNPLPRDLDNGTRQPERSLLPRKTTGDV